MGQNYPLWVLDTLSLLSKEEVENALEMIAVYWETGEEKPPIGNERYPWPAFKLWLDNEKNNPKRIRNSKEYMAWRLEVFKRDGFKCQICGKVGGELNAHHIKRFSTYLNERLNVDNGITLCKKCHREIHRKK